MSTQHLAIIGTQKIQQATNLAQIYTIAVETIQQLVRCNHVAIFQLDDNRQPELKAEIRNEEVSRTLRVKRKRQVCREYRLSRVLGPFSSSYRTFPILEMSISQPQSEVWGYIAVHQPSQEQSMSWDVQLLVHQLLFQVAIAIQQIDIRMQQERLAYKRQEIEQYELNMLRTLAHEYRTPLTKILVAASTLENHSNALEPATRKRFLKLMQEQVQFLSNVTDRILNK